MHTLWNTNATEDSAAGNPSLPHYANKSPSQFLEQYDMSRPFVFYAILGVDWYASRETIIDAYELVHQYFDPADWEDAQEEAKTIRANLTLAKSILTNDVKKILYDHFYASEILFVPPNEPVEIISEEEMSDQHIEANIEPFLESSPDESDIDYFDNDSSDTTYPIISSDDEDEDGESTIDPPVTLVKYGETFIPVRDMQSTTEDIEHMREMLRELEKEDIANAEKKNALISTGADIVYPDIESSQDSVTLESNSHSSSTLKSILKKSNDTITGSMLDFEQYKKDILSHDEDSVNTIIEERKSDQAIDNALEYIRKPSEETVKSNEKLDTDDRKTSNESADKLNDKLANSVTSNESLKPANEKLISDGSSRRTSNESLKPANEKLISDGSSRRTSSECANRLDEESTDIISCERTSDDGAIIMNENPDTNCQRPYMEPINVNRCRRKSFLIIKPDQETNASNALILNASKEIEKLEDCTENNGNRPNVPKDEPENLDVDEENAVIDDVSKLLPQ